MNYHLASSYYSFMFRRSPCDREPIKHAIPLTFQKMFVSVTYVYVYLCVYVLYTCMLCNNAKRVTYLYVSFFVSFFFFLFFSLQCVFKFSSFFNYHFSSFLFRLFATSFFLSPAFFISRCVSLNAQLTSYSELRIYKSCLSNRLCIICKFFSRLIGNIKFHALTLAPFPFIPSGTRAHTQTYTQTFPSFLSPRSSHTPFIPTLPLVINQIANRTVAKLGRNHGVPLSPLIA